MQYPLISEYVEAIRSAEDNFNQLSDLRPVLDSNGNPVMSSGNFAVVFKMQDVNTQQLYAVKCFTREQEKREEHYRKIAEELEFTSSPYLLHFRYLEDELFVDTTQSGTNDFPVLVMDWAEGVTLDNYLKAHLHDSYVLQLLAYRFCRLGAWLLSQPFAHGDLKPDNILVKKDGSLVLVDYDGMFVPALQDENANELGSPDFRHPLRTEATFNEHIDDFAIASIALSLKAIALQPSLYNQFATADRLLLSASDYRDIGKSAALQAILALSSDAELAKLFSAFLLASSLNSLGMLSFRLFILQQPEKPKEEIRRTDVTDEDRQNAVKDEFGVSYSADGIRLIEAPSNLVSYQIKEGTKVICDSAFRWKSGLKTIHIPNSVTQIGDRVFAECRSLQSINIPNSVTQIGDCAFYGCEYLQSIHIPNSVKHIGINPFLGCLQRINIFYLVQLRLISDSPYFKVINGLLISSDGTLISCLSRDTHIHIPNSVTHIGDSAFSGCENLRDMHIPNSVTHIGDSAFSGCENLRDMHIPNSVTHIGDSAFSGCENLRDIHISNSVTQIGENAFGGCSSLQSIHISNSVTQIGDYAFDGCEDLQSIHLPNSVTQIGNGAFWNCSSLQDIHLPNSVTQIGNGAFRDCSSLQSIHLPNSVTQIGVFAFYNCEALQSIHIPTSVTYIGKNPFLSCPRLRLTVDSSYFKVINELLISSDGTLISCLSKDTHIHIPNSVTQIGDSAFSECYSLQSIHLPNSVTQIGDCAFYGCEYLQSIHISNSVTQIGDYAFNECYSLQSIHLPNSVTQIGENAFRECSSLQSIHIPNSVTQIGKDAFRGCRSLQTIHIPKGSMAKFMQLLPEEFHDKLVEI